jgi:hypothetical protein
MSCCGDKRLAVSTRPASPAMTFEYQGRTSLTVVGAASRRVYWFAGPGARVQVHPLDVDSLKDVPKLGPIQALR